MAQSEKRFGGCGKHLSQGAHLWTLARPRAAHRGRSAIGASSETRGSAHSEEQGSGSHGAPCRCVRSRDGIACGRAKYQASQRACLRSCSAPSLFSSSGLAARPVRFSGSLGSGRTNRADLASESARLALCAGLSAGASASAWLPPARWSSPRSRRRPFACSGERAWIRREQRQSQTQRRDGQREEARRRKARRTQAGIRIVSGSSSHFPHDCTRQTMQQSSV
eukprot:2947688-Pleurochrysis_carterae.AAC.4